jgi:nitrogen fixation protein FixH
MLENSKQPRELTGRMVLAMVLAFFALIFGVNAYMALKAVSTFGGVDTESSYRAGKMFERDVAVAKAQDERHWQVEATVAPTAGGNAVLDIVARDSSGASLSGLTAIAQLERPTDRRLDRVIVASEGTPGRFYGSATIPAGQWDLVIDLWRGGERVFRSKNRIVLR